MQKLIVTADDYGMCDAVDKAIDAGIANGFITTTNVMVNMETLSNARKLRERFPHISVGLHWNVTTGKPITNAEMVPSLVDENGSFWSIAMFKKRYSKGLIVPTELQTELEAQYILFKSTCGEPDYWNTHENSSLHVRAYKVFENVAKAHGIKATRNFQRVYYDKVNLGFRREFRELLVRNFFQIWFKHIGKVFIMPTARVISFDKIRKTEGDVLLKALQKDGRDYIEVVFHPAMVADSPYFGKITSKRVEEYAFVSSKDIFEKYIFEGFRFVSFKDIDQ